MKCGDLVRYDTDSSRVGIVLEIRRYRISQDRGYHGHSQMLYSFEMLGHDGTRNWYDVWIDDEIKPEVVT